MLYVLDGDVAFGLTDGWLLDQQMTRLIALRRIPPIIAIGIAGAGYPARLWEYDPHMPRPYYNGTAFLQSLVDTLKPFVDARFRTLPDHAHCYIAGASLGGLMAAYAGYSRDDVFSRIVAISPAYYWRRPGLPEEVRLAPKPHISLFYQDTGTIEDNYIDGMAAVAQAQGFALGTDFHSHHVEGATHSVACWRSRLSDILVEACGMQ